MLCGPKEIDAVQEPDEQRRIAERRQGAGDVGDEKDREHRHMGIVAPSLVGADQRLNDDHGGAGRADHARQHHAGEQHSGIAKRIAVKIAGHQDAASHDVKGKQQDDEAEIVGQHRVQYRRGGGGGSDLRGERHDRHDRPCGDDLAVMAQPERRHQHGYDRDGQQQAKEWHGRRPRQCRRAMDGHRDARRCHCRPCGDGTRPCGDGPRGIPHEKPTSGAAVTLGITGGIITGWIAKASSLRFHAGGADDSPERRVSSAMKAPNSCSEGNFASAPRVLNFATMSGDFSPAIIAPRNRSMIGRGVPSGARIPVHDEPRRSRQTALDHGGNCGQSGQTLVVNDT